jgi:hypothetical protein
MISTYGSRDIDPHVSNIDATHKNTQFNHTRFRFGSTIRKNGRLGVKRAFGSKGEDQHMLLPLMVLPYPFCGF